MDKVIVTILPLLTLWLIKYKDFEYIDYLYNQYI